MLDRAVRRRIDPYLDQVADFVWSRGIGADQITWAGFAIGLLCMAATAVGWQVPAIILLLGNRLCDGLDGAVARLTNPTERGAYLDIVLDFLFYAGFAFAFAVADKGNALAAAFLVFSFVGTGTTFLAHAIVAAQRGWPSDTVKRKGFAHLGGVTEGTETILIFMAMLCWPAGFMTLAWIFGALCWLTTASRIVGTLRALRR